MNFTLKGSEVLVFDLANRAFTYSEKISQSFDTTMVLPDSSLISDSTTIDATVNEYDWQLVEKERELKLLKAKFTVAKSRWLLLLQLLELNRDHQGKKTTIVKRAVVAIENVDFLASPSSNDFKTDKVKKGV